MAALSLNTFKKKVSITRCLHHAEINIIANDPRNSSTIRKENAAPPDKIILFYHSSPVIPPIRG